MSETGPETYDPNEMAMFGFDPANPDDVAAWHQIDAQVDQAPVNQDTFYAQDSFEFGGLPPSTQPDTSGTIPPTN